MQIIKSLIVILLFNTSSLHAQQVKEPPFGLRCSLYGNETLQKEIFYLNFENKKIIRNFLSVGEIVFSNQIVVNYRFGDDLDNGLIYSLHKPSGQITATFKNEIVNIWFRCDKIDPQVFRFMVLK
jgi:hypothetical protein